jgi:hypothetical protein
MQVKLACGGVDFIPLKFRVTVAVRKREKTIPVETKSVEIPNHNNPKIMAIELFSKKRK